VGYDHAVELPVHDGDLEIAPALAAGNTSVLKSDLTPITRWELGKLSIRRLPRNRNVITRQGRSWKRARFERQVDMVSLTGDTATAERDHGSPEIDVKKLHLELGGKGPVVVFDDANVAAAAEGAVRRRW